MEPIFGLYQTWLHDLIKIFIYNTNLNNNDKVFIKSKNVFGKIMWINGKSLQIVLLIEKIIIINNILFLYSKNRRSDIYFSNWKTDSEIAENHQVSDCILYTFTFNAYFSDIHPRS